MTAEFQPIPEGDQGRNTTNAELCRSPRIRFRVEFQHQDSAGPVLGELINRRGHRPARRAPIRVEINQDGDAGAFDYPLEIGVCDSLRAVQRKRLPTLGAPGPVVEPGQIDAIHRIAEQASNQDRLCSAIRLSRQQRSPFSAPCHLSV
jgi:hypothetical protein